MIAVLLIVAWAPQFIATLVWSARPELAASYGPQAFAMGWLGITLVCSV